MKSAAQDVESYTYRTAPSPRLPEWLCAPPDEGNAAPEVSEQARLEWERRMAAEAAQSFAAGRERGVEEGRAAESRQHGDRLRGELAGLAQTFAEARERYLQNVEAEVVKLALAIAERILRREAQMDPLLLTGAVRVALGQLGASTKVRLRVPAAQHALWTEAMALLPGIAKPPQVIADEALALGECVVETELGMADLGLRAQLAEIERGSFDAAPQKVQKAAQDTAQEATRAQP